VKTKRSGASIAVLTVCFLVVVNGLGFMAYRYLSGGKKADADTAQAPAAQPDPVVRVKKVSNKSVKQLRKAAMTDIVNGEWEAAIKVLEKALAISPDDTELKELLDRAKSELAKSAGSQDNESTPVAPDDDDRVASAKK
jgi:hypothetical protein